jgi:hypothetical protein
MNLWGFGEFLYEAPLFDIENSGTGMRSVILAFLPVSMLSRAHVR